MLKTALDLFDERSCSVCVTPWDPAEFRTLVAAQRKLLADAARERQSAEAKSAPHSAALEALNDAFALLGSYAANLPVPVDAAAFASLNREIERRVDVLRRLLPIELSIAALSGEIVEIAPAAAFLERLEAGIGYASAVDRRLPFWRHGDYAAQASLWGAQFQGSRSSMRRAG